MTAQILKPASELAQRYKPVSGESEKYTDARKALLEAEIEERRTMTRVTEKRRALPPGSHAERLSVQGRAWLRCFTGRSVWRARNPVLVFLDVWARA